LRERSKNGNELSRTDKCDETQKDSPIFLFVRRSKAEFFNKKENVKKLNIQIENQQNGIEILSKEYLSSCSLL
jgi:hypothetical protein